MPLPVYRLRRILAATAVLLVVVVAGMYFYARLRATNALKTIPGKIGYNIKQTAQGFQFSKSDGKRTLFTVQAKKVTEFKLNGESELHNVSIVLYGRDSSRFDQIYGDDFAYNQKTGDVTAKGEVQIDLVANPAGSQSPDQSTPKELNSAIHLKTRDLIFNKNSGNAWTDARVEWRTPQASGWAVGVKYSGKRNTLTLGSQIHMVLSNPQSALIDAKSGVVTSDPHQIVLQGVQLSRPGTTLQADEATLFLTQDNHVDRVIAVGNIKTEVRTDTRGPDQVSEIHGSADQAEFLLLPGDKNRLHTATLSGSVRFEQSGTQQIQGEAGRVIFDFTGRNELQSVHALDGAHLTQTASRSAAPVREGAPSQNFDLQAPQIDFSVAEGHALRQASTSGPALITILESPSGLSATPAIAQRTIVTAAKFVGRFAEVGGKNRLASIHGGPDARIVNSVPGQPDRVSTSQSVDATFLPEGGIGYITQTGNLAFTDGQEPEKRIQAWANFGRYTPADHILSLTGSPRVVHGGMETTADRIRINRGTGEALAEGNVKSTYSELNEQPDGALLASSSPIHATAQRMTARNSPAIARYNGAARLWQDANVIEAPTIEFDRDHRSLVAQGTPTTPVRTILSENVGNGNQKGRSRPVFITALKLTYVDTERRVHYEGGVLAKGDGFTASSDTADAFLARRGQPNTRKEAAGPGQLERGPSQLERVIAEGGVLIRQPGREARGQTLTYTAPDEKFVLTGGSPSIFDAEQGKITGVSLTFFRRDDRVLVEGKESAPVVTTTRVAR